MPEQIVITSRPMAPPTASGRRGAFGMHDATLHLPDGRRIWGRGFSHQEARAHALKRAALEYAEVCAHLTAVELEAADVEAGLLDWRE